MLHKCLMSRMSESSAYGKQEDNLVYSLDLPCILKIYLKCKGELPPTHPLPKKAILAIRVVIESQPSLSACFVPSALSHFPVIREGETLYKEMSSFVAHWT